jgi:hypothetical protein
MLHSECVDLLKHEKNELKQEFEEVEALEIKTNCYFTEIK